jgi:hypothetical protein
MAVEAPALVQGQLTHVSSVSTAVSSLETGTLFSVRTLWSLATPPDLELALAPIPLQWSGRRLSGHAAAVILSR